MEKLKSSPDASTEIETSSHIPVKPIYTPADLKGSDYESEVGYPGEYPFTRGVQASYVPRTPLDHAPVRWHGRRRGIQ